MKVTWEASDIKAGRRYSKPGISEIWMIGYLAGADEPNRWVSISSEDGMVTLPYTREQMAESLTNAEYLPVEVMEHTT